ncbi:SDR family NAD(P)-dependent oxidoreductase [Nannocystaceae bacterium ST9]
MPIDLRGRRILVTGASRGLGALIARGLAGPGVELVVSARELASLAETVQACEALGATVTPLAADLIEASQRERLIAQAGELDVLINNAGVEHTLRLLDQSDAQVHAQLEINIAAPIDLTRRVLPGMLARKRGTIVNVSSMSGKSPTPYNSIYAASKHALNGFSSSLRIELLGSGVHVGVVCPSFVAEAGMWARTGLRAPAAMREVSPSKVVAGVFAVLGGAREVLITPGPVRPMLALRELFPGIDAPLLRSLGVLRTLAARADAGENE